MQSKSASPASLVSAELHQPDAAIAAGANAMFELNGSVPDSVLARVENGRIVLSGEVTWRFQREAAEETVRHLRGVREIRNDITLALAPGDGGDHGIRLGED